MYKRSYSEFETECPTFIPIQFKQPTPISSYKKFKTHDETTETLSSIELMLSNILITLEKISTRLELCEKKIAYIHESQVKNEQEKLEQKIRDTEIFNSYIS